MKLATEFIPLNDGTQICAPSNITLMTSYVLREQGDWFEDEIHFIRKFIKPGMVSLDIGANYGLYATAIAKNMGPKGRLWCFEPTPNTAEALRHTFKKNKYRGRVKVVEAGLSNKAGTATFFMSPNAELNTLEPGDESFMQEQTIELLTLDDYARNAGFSKVDFVKLDAEGEEVRILEGGQSFFSDFSPLVMFELMHVEQVNEALLTRFTELGYAFYYLVPGLNTLAPYSIGMKVDRYLLNLFALKGDRLEELRSAGFIVDPLVSDGSESVAERLGEGCPKNKVLALLPDGLKEPDSDSELLHILRLLVCARDSDLAKQERFEALSAAFSSVLTVSIESAGPELLATAARVAFDMGQRELGVRMLEAFVKSYIASGVLPNIDTVYYPADKAHDKKAQLILGDASASFCVMMIDTYIRKAHRSGYFAGQALAPCFAALRKLGWLSKEIEIRERVSHARDAAMRA